MKEKKKMFRFSKTRIPVFMTLLVFGFISVSGLYSPPDIQAASSQGMLAPESFTELAKKNSPAVVNIRTERTGGGPAQMFRGFEGSPYGNDERFRDFFEKFFGGPNQREFKQRSLGSGFIIDEDGHIVTNNHVVEGADKIKVILNDEREFDAVVKGRDPNTDLALIKIEADGKLPKLELGNSDDAGVGEWVLAIGNPFGLDHTVTAGIISAKGRVIGSGPYDDFIQTDASINPGNSGGPLLTMDGKVVGINTAIIAGGTGIGFAIPVDMAKGIIAQLKSSGEVSRGWLGVGIQDLTKDLKDYYGVKEGEGVLITQVFKGDPADKAGIEPKDIVLSVNGEKVDGSRDLSRIIAEKDVGKKVELEILRNGKEKTVTVELAKRKDLPGGPEVITKKSGGEFGITVSDLTPEWAARLNVDEGEGVVVTNVAEDGKGDKAGVQPGDLIKEVNRKEVKDKDDYMEEVGAVKEGEPVNLLILRPGRGIMVIKMTR
ncbi:MAG: DegQ family serine endoprotease [Deltaproteobacteria bacterium]|nr:DegQ family serine endoprotease [Deltaproteobacteria bacterium]